MESLKYSIVSTTTKQKCLYIHKEKQMYKLIFENRYRKTYKCSFKKCKCEITRINHNCYKRNQDEVHNHTENREEEFRQRMKRVFATRVMDRMLKEKGKIDNEVASEILTRKVGQISRKTINDIKRNLLGRRGTKCTGTFLTVEPVHIIPLNKISQLKNKLA